MVKPVIDAFEKLKSCQDFRLVFIEGCQQTHHPSLYTFAFLGLQPAVDDLNRAYGEFSNTGISRADFYAKCGQVGAERGRQNAGKLSSHTTQ